jgi:hypothetical protein
MTGKHRAIAVSGIVLLPALATLPGGWATITVEDVPDHLMVRQPVTLEYTVRQHGKQPLDGLRGMVVARDDNGRELRVNAQPGRGAGRYVATLTVPEPGNWQLTIRSGFGPSNLSLLPVRAVAPGVPVAAPSPADRGRRLFVAKGCVTCHRHSGIAGSVGTGAPDLPNRALDPGFLARFLADPQAVSSRSDRFMPNLQLDEPEITALVAFLDPTPEVRQARR